MSSTSLRLTDVCVIIVTYNPKIQEFRNKLLYLADQGIRACVVDNTESKELIINVKSLESKTCNIISLGTNQGIAFAQNRGIDWAFQHGFSAVLTMDQDSGIDVDMIISLISAYNELSILTKVACVGPIAYDHKRGEQSTYSTNTSQEIIQSVYEVSYTLSSGMLISRQAIESIGLMDEVLFIDLVDWEWCFRAKSKGYRTFITKEAMMPHQLGESRIPLIFGFEIGVPSPIRHYYQFRNYFYLLNRSYIPLTFKAKYAIINLIKLVFYTLIVKPRFDRFKNSINGIIDGIKYLSKKK